MDENAAFAAEDESKIKNQAKDDVHAGGDQEIQPASPLAFIETKNERQSRGKADENQENPQIPKDQFQALDGFQAASRSFRTKAMTFFSSAGEQTNISLS